MAAAKKAKTNASIHSLNQDFAFLSSSMRSFLRCQNDFFSSPVSLFSSNVLFDP